MDRKILISYIVVNYRTAHLVRQCLESIRRHNTLPYEIIVVDNASEDNCQAAVAGELHCTYIQNESNVGFGAANNIGARKARGRYLFFLNSDTYLLDDAALAFHDFMENKQHEDVGCCGGSLVDESMGQQVSHGNFPSLFQEFSQLGFYRLYPRYYRERLSISGISQGERAQTVDYLSGADMFFRASVFRDLGGFDEDFFLYFEEVELAYRMQQSGFRSVLLPSIQIVHLEGGSVSGQEKWSLAKTAYFEQSRQLYYRKTKGVLVAFVVKLILCAQAFGRWCIHRDGHHLKVFRIIANA